jgi:hypothetical protein
LTVTVPVLVICSVNVTRSPTFTTVALDFSDSVRLAVGAVVDAAGAVAGVGGGGADSLTTEGE